MNVCHSGEHVFNGRNFGYKGLAGLLRKLASEPLSKPWWVRDKITLDRWGKTVRKRLQTVLSDVGDRLAFIVATNLARLSEEFLATKEDLLDTLCDVIVEDTRETASYLLSTDWWNTTFPEELEKQLLIPRRKPSNGKGEL